jgi:hypothetical protein
MKILLIEGGSGRAGRALDVGLDRRRAHRARHLPGARRDVDVDGLATVEERPAVTRVVSDLIVHAVPQN